MQRGRLRTRNVGKASWGGNTRVVLTSGVKPTIIVKTFGTLCVLGEGKCNSSWPPSPLNSVGCYKSNTFYISCTLYGPQLCLGGWGKNLVKAVFMSVYCRLAANSIQKPSEKGEVSQNLLARIVRNVAILKSLPNVIILHFQYYNMKKVLEF